MRPKTRFDGELVEAAGHARKGLSSSMFVAKCQGLYVVREAFDSGHFLISRLGPEDLMISVNAKG